MKELYIKFTTIVFILMISLIMAFIILPAYATDNPELANQENQNIEVANSAAEHQIIVQPQDVSVGYPDSASFEVEVSDPNDVAAYEWRAYSNKRSLEQILDGLSSKTNNLIIPSTKKEYNNISFYCVITYNDGTSLTSQKALLTINNYDANLNVVYVCDYSLLSGESLNLGDIGYGSGIISFVDDSTIQVNNVYLNNYNTIVGFTNLGIAEYNIHNNQLLFNFQYEAIQKEMNVEFVGQNTVINRAFDKGDEFYGGHVIEFFSRNSNSEDYTKLNIKGIDNASLDITGAECFIINNSDISINNLDIKLEYLQNNIQSKYGAITAYNSRIDNKNSISDGVNINNSNIDFNIKGCAMCSIKNLSVQNSSIKADTNIVSNFGAESKSGIIDVDENCNIDNSLLDLNDYQDTQSRIMSTEGMALRRDCCFNNSIININVQHMDGEQVNEVIGISSVYGKFDGYIPIFDINNSDISIKLGQEINRNHNSYGIRDQNQNQTFTINESHLDIECYSNGYSYGIDTHANISLLGSTTNILVDCIGSSFYYTSGINNDCGITLIDLYSQEDYLNIKCVAPDDPNVMTISNWVDTDTEKGTKIQFGDNTKLPEDEYIGIHHVDNVPFLDKCDYETIFSTADPTSPSSEMHLIFAGINPPTPGEDVDSPSNLNTSPLTGDANLPIQVLFIVFLLSAILFTTNKRLLKN